MPGLGISEFRIFIGATLTGAIAEVMCFGPNDAISNLPGMFPIRFDGNCIFATQPLTQCEDDGSSEDPLVTESDIASEINGDNADDGNGNNSGNSFTNADSCSFYEPLNSYPVDLSQSVSQYLSQSTDANASNLEAAISNHSDVITDTTGSTDSGLYLATSSPDDSYSRLNGVRGLSFDSSGSGTGMLQISLDSTKLNLRDFGKVLDINLRSIKAFPNFIMDWYHRQMDEIMASIGHLPDIKIFLPDLSSLADTGWM